MIRERTRKHGTLIEDMVEVAAKLYTLSYAGEMRGSTARYIETPDVNQQHTRVRRRTEYDLMRTRNTRRLNTPLDGKHCIRGCRDF